MWFRAVLVRHCEMVSDTLLAAAILGRCPTALWPCMQKNYCQAHLRYPSSEKEHEDAANEEEAEAEEEEDEEEAEEEAEAEEEEEEKEKEAEEDEEDNKDKDVTSEQTCGGGG